jgi:hypothetical protein
MNRSKNLPIMYRNISQSALKITTVLAAALLLIHPLLRAGNPPDNQPASQDNLTATVEQVRLAHAPDGRVDVFQIDLIWKGGEVIVKGELANPGLKGVLLDSLRLAAGGQTIIDSIQVLPLPELQPRVYGIVSVSVANMRRTPSHHAELVNQALLGTVVKLLKYEHGFYYVQNWDRYLGWISSAEMVEVDSITAADWQQGPRVVCVSNYGVVRDRARPDGAVIVDLVPRAILKTVRPKGKWVEVMVPSGQIGFVEKKLVVDEAAFIGTPASRKRLLSVARSYLGIPYLWGGTSTKGFDCSGFTQTVCRMNNISLPRDASQQVLVGESVEPGQHFENVLPGDLLFFGSSPTRITHVGMYLGKDNFIHSSGWVHINSLNPEHERYNEYRHKYFQAVRRVLKP